MPDIELPANGWHPRPHQMKLWAALEAGKKRGLAVWHRRAGKDDVALHWAAVASAERVANYWHMLPEAAQARKAIWTAINPHTGKKRIDEAFPLELRATTRDQEMMIVFVNGSTWQVVGSDNFDSLVGSAPAGIVFSEYALANPVAWAMMRPILLENGGWALFISTPRGRNHLSTFYQGVKDDPLWYCEKLSARETGVFTEEQLAQERIEYERDFGEDGSAKFEQEYECSFDAAISGSYYGKLMQTMDDEGRIGFVPYDPRLPVTTAWDLGFGDTTPIGFFQFRGASVAMIDFLEASGMGADYYAGELKSRGYVYKEHILPHDADHGEWGNGKKRVDTLRALGFTKDGGLGPLRVLPRTSSVDDGIAAVRALMPRMQIDRKKCSRAIDALQQYRKSWDEVNKIWRPKPVHDWTSHTADMLRELAVGMSDKPEPGKPATARVRRMASGPTTWMAG